STDQYRSLMISPFAPTCVQTFPSLCAARERRSNPMISMRRILVAYLDYTQFNRLLLFRHRYRHTNDTVATSSGRIFLVQEDGIIARLQFAELKSTVIAGLNIIIEIGVVSVNNVNILFGQGVLSDEGTDTVELLSEKG